MKQNRGHGCSTTAGGVVRGPIPRGGEGVASDEERGTHPFGRAAGLQREGVVALFNLWACVGYAGQFALSAWHRMPQVLVRAPRGAEGNTQAWAESCRSTPGARRGMAPHEERRSQAV